MICFIAHKVHNSKIYWPTQFLFKYCRTLNIQSKINCSLCIQLFHQINYIGTISPRNSTRSTYCKMTLDLLSELFYDFNSSQIKLFYEWNRVCHLTLSLLKGLDQHLKNNNKKSEIIKLHFMSWKVPFLSQGDTAAVLPKPSI